MTHATARGNGRAGAKLRAALREQIVSGKFPSAEFLPSVRQLGEEYGVTRKTANRALKALEVEGLIAAEPRRGYRVLPGAGDPDRGCPVAFVDQLEETAQDWETEQRDFLKPFQAAAGRHGWSLLAIEATGQNSQDVMRQLITARACGAVLSAVSSDLAALAQESGLPTVVVDWWFDDLAIDSVLQDNFQGGVLAARHLLQRGHKRIAWLGPTTATNHSMSRLGGATMELQRASLGLAPDLCVPCKARSAAREARRLLSKRNRPDAVLAMWSGIAVELVAGARELGLRPGVDFEMVGWSREEEYERGYKPAFNGEALQPAVVWSPRQMAELAVERLATRKRNPDLAPVKISVPVSLKLPEGQIGENRR
jgi:DNA-binding LacI/PurR family transcriptional regulator